MAESITRWLEGLGQHTQAFADNAANLATITHLLEPYLVELRPPLKHRRKLQAAMAALATDGYDSHPSSSSDRNHAPVTSDAEHRQLTV